MNDTLAILEKLHRFYSDSFTQLITYTVALLGAVGVIVPALAAFLQTRAAKREHAALTQQIQEQLAGARAELRDELARENEETAKKFQSAMDKMRAEMHLELARLNEHAQAGIVFMQAKASMDQQRYAACFRDAIGAAASCAKSHDENNLQAALTLAHKALGHLTKDEVDKDRTKTRLEDLYRELDKLNKNGRYQRDIDRIKEGVASAYRTASARKPGDDEDE